MENSDSVLCLPVLESQQPEVLVNDVNTCSSPPHLHIELSCATIHKFLNVIDEFSPVQILYEEVNPQISSSICFHSFETFQEAITRLLSDWKIPSYCHAMVVAPMLSRVGEILGLPFNEGRLLPTLCLHLNSFLFHAQDMRLFSLWVFQKYREQEEIIRHGMIPASPTSIESLKRKKMDSENDSNGDLSCAICLEEFPAESEVTCMPCSHMFHNKCITEWLKRSHYCPLCCFKMPTDHQLEKRRKFFRLFVHIMELAGGY